MPWISLDVSVTGVDGLHEAIRLSKMSETIRKMQKSMIDLGMSASRSAKYMWAYGKFFHGPKLVRYERYTRQYERRKHERGKKKNKIRGK